MTANIQRFTVEYDTAEDRISLAGELGGGTMVIWLTRRLTELMVPQILHWMETKAPDLPKKEARVLPRPQVLHSFAQHAASAALTPEVPVRAKLSSAQWVAHTVHISVSQRAMRVEFVSRDGHSAYLTLAAQPLRQWLHVMYLAYIKAGWPLGVWPDWVSEGGQAGASSATVLH